MVLSIPQIRNLCKVPHCCCLMGSLILSCSTAGDSSDSQVATAASIQQQAGTGGSPSSPSSEVRVQHGWWVYLHLCQLFSWSRDENLCIRLCGPTWRLVSSGKGHHWSHPLLCLSPAQECPSPPSAPPTPHPQVYVQCWWQVDDAGNRMLTAQGNCCQGSTISHILQNLPSQVI